MPEMRMKKLLLLSVLAVSGLAHATEAVPDVVKNFSEQQGIKIIKKIDAPGGASGWLGQYQDMGVTLFLTPDGKHVISGYLYDDKGKNLSEEYFQKEIYIPLGKEMWKTLNAAHPLKEGADTAPRKVFVFADPFCPYCKTFWSEAQPWVKAGKVQLNTLLVAFLNPNSGRNASAILMRKIRSARGGTMSFQVVKRCRKHKAIPRTQPLTSCNSIRRSWIRWGPCHAAIYYLNAKNELQQVVGMPDEKQLLEMFGPKPQ
jgi:thiol:disulfide interchange protein DsbG